MSSFKQETCVNVFKYGTFNLLAVLSLAQQVRGKKCFCDLSQTPKSGSLNWAIFLSFEDGIKWVFRSPRLDGVGPGFAQLLVASEAATLRFVKENSQIPVPKVYAYSHTTGGEIGVPYILMEKAHGMPLSTFNWDPALSSQAGEARPPITPQAKEKIMYQLGEITSQLFHLRFDRIGSLVEDENLITITKCLHPALLWHGRDSYGEPDVLRGPFVTDADFYKALLSSFTLHVECLPMDHHVFFAPLPLPHEYQSFEQYRFATDLWNDFVTLGMKNDSGRNRLDYVMAGKVMESIIPSLSQAHLALEEKGGFPLHHPDLSVSNIFIDADFNISCVIDWGFSSCVPLSLLLATPGLPHPRDDMDPALTTLFRKGFLEGLQSSTQILPPPSIFSTSRKAWLFARITSLDCPQDVKLFTELVSMTLQKHNISVPAWFTKMAKRKRTLEKLQSLTAENRPREEIGREEAQYFFCTGSRRLALARKLTLVAQLNEDSVADSKLWRWMMQYVQARDSIMSL